MPPARPKPSATISFRMYVLTVIAVRKDPQTWDIDFSGGLTDRGYTIHSLFRPFGKHLEKTLWGILILNKALYMLASYYENIVKPNYMTWEEFGLPILFPW